MMDIFPDLLVDSERMATLMVSRAHDCESTTTRASSWHFLIPLVRSAFTRVHPRLVLPGTMCRSCLPIDPANGLQIRYDHRDQLFWFQHLAVGPPVHDPALDQAEVIDVESEDQGAVGLRFEDLAGMPLLLADDSGIVLGESQHDVVISVAPDRAEGLRHVIPGPEAGRAEEARARLHHQTHPLDLEQPDVVPQAAMTNQAPVVVGSKYQVVGIDGPPLRLVPTRSPVDHAQLPRLTYGRHQNPKDLRIIRRLNAGQDRQATG